MLSRKNLSLLMAALVPVFVLMASFFVSNVRSDDPVLEQFSSGACQTKLEDIWDDPDVVAKETLHSDQMCPEIPAKYKGAWKTYEKAWFWWRQDEGKIRWTRDPQEWWFDNAPTYCWHKFYVPVQTGEDGWWMGDESAEYVWNTTYGWVIQGESDWKKYKMIKPTNPGAKICPSSTQSGSTVFDCSTQQHEEEPFYETISGADNDDIWVGDSTGYNYPCLFSDDLGTTGWPL